MNQPTAPRQAKSLRQMDFDFDIEILTFDEFTAEVAVYAETHATFFIQHVTEVTKEAIEGDFANRFGEHETRVIGCEYIAATTIKAVQLVICEMKIDIKPPMILMDEIADALETYAAELAEDKGE